MQSAAETKRNVIKRKKKLAGLPRTGTMSTRTALEKLDLAPCFHGDCPITQNLAGPATQFYRGEKDALLDALRSCPAGLDWPIVGLFDK